MTEVNNMGKTKLDTQYKWRKENLKNYHFDLNKVTDKDVYEHLEKQPNKRAYLIDLIRKDLENQNDRI